MSIPIINRKITFIEDQHFQLFVICGLSDLKIQKFKKYF